MGHCTKCNNDFPSGYSFCPKDHVQLIEAAGSVHVGGAMAAAPARINTPYHEETSTSDQTNPTTLPSSIKADKTDESVSLLAVVRHHAIFLITVVIITSLGVALVIYLNYPTAKRTILKEINKGNFVKPEGESAYDLFLKARADLNARDLEEISGVAAPALENKGNQILARLKQDANESEAEWAEATRVYSWLNDIRPKPAYESRKYFSQARLAFLKKDFSRSISDYQRSIQIDSSWALPFNGLGRVYVNLKDKVTARQYYSRATEIEPNWIFPWLNLGALCLELNDHQSAQVALQRALSIDDRKPSAHFLLGQSYEKTGRMCNAINEYGLALSNINNSASPGFNVDSLRSKQERLVAKHNCFNVED